MVALVAQDSSVKEIKLETDKETFRERWRNFVDSGLRLLLSEEKVKKVWRFLYRYNPWRVGGLLVGSLIINASMQLSASAQIAGDAEEAVEQIFGPHLDGATDFVQVLFGSGRLLVFVFGMGLVVYGIFDGISNRGSNWHIWAGIGSTLSLGVVLISVLEGAIFGGGGGTPAIP